MSRTYLILSCLIGACFLFFIGVAVAVDPPHDSSTSTSCTSCHTLHNSVGPSLTNNTNAALCQSCHVSGGSATNKPLYNANQASPAGSTGNSHRWDVALPAVSSPNNAYGLKAAADITNTNLKRQLTKFSNVIVCSVCHDVHSQSNAPWEPFAEGGTATAGTTTTITDSSKSWAVNQWASRYIKMTSGANNYQVRQITSNTATQITVTSAFSSAVAATDTYIIADGRHYPRMANDANQMCEDCHYYRSAASGQTNVRVWDGNKKSHPVGGVFSNVNGETRTVIDGLQFMTSPVEPQAASFAAQTGTRYRGNGTGDTNLTNNLVVDPSYQVKCLSCHGVHWTDSNSATVDGP